MTFGEEKEICFVLNESTKKLLRIKTSSIGFICYRFIIIVITFFHINPAYSKTLMGINYKTISTL